MPTYIRSKINTSAPAEFVIETDGSLTKFKENGTFKVPGEYNSADEDLGSLRYQNGHLETKDVTGWQALSTNYTIGTQITDAINALIANAPVALDTLNELAAALNNNANFGSTVINLISEKLSKSGDTMTGSLILNDDPVNALGAATKQYVDNATSSIEVTSTTDVPEGDNLYFTVGRARNAISAGGDLSYNSSTGVISYSYSLPTASTSTLGGVKVDGTTITINNGVISASGNITGNAGTVTNGVYTTGSYNNPSWITSLAYSKLSGAPTLATVATSGSYNDLTNKPTGLATETYVNTAVSNLVNSAPSALNTLNELAQALGNDSNFATTISNQIGTKLATADFNSTFDTRLATKTTTALTEGTNLYFTTARARNSVSEGIGINYDSTTGIISVNTTVIPTKSYVDGKIANLGTTVDNLADSVGTYMATNSVTIATLIELINSLSNTASTTARNAVSAGNGINYNSNTGVMSLSNTATLDGGTY